MIVDANVILSALLGRSFPRLVRIRDAALDLAAPEHQLREVRLILRHRFDLADDIIADGLARIATVVDPIDPSFYLSSEQAARRRLAASGQRDWPVLAAALALGRPILSDDRDFFGVGVPVWLPRILDSELETSDA